MTHSTSTGRDDSTARDTRTAPEVDPSDLLVEGSAFDGGRSFREANALIARTAEAMGATPEYVEAARAGTLPSQAREEKIPAERIVRPYAEDPSVINHTTDLPEPRIASGWATSYGRGEVVTAVVRWFNRTERDWVVMYVDAEGNQVGAAQYVGSKADALETVSDFIREALTFRVAITEEDRTAMAPDPTTDQSPVADVDVDALTFGWARLTVGDDDVTVDDTSGTIRSTTFGGSRAMDLATAYAKALSSALDSGADPESAALAVRANWLDLAQASMGQVETYALDPEVAHEAGLHDDESDLECDICRDLIPSVRQADEEAEAFRASLGIIDRKDLSPEDAAAYRARYPEVVEAERLMEANGLEVEPGMPVSAEHARAMLANVDPGNPEVAAAMGVDSSALYVDADYVDEYLRVLAEQATELRLSLARWPEAETVIAQTISDLTVGATVQTLTPASQRAFRDLAYGLSGATSPLRAR